MGSAGGMASGGALPLPSDPHGEASTLSPFSGSAPGSARAHPWAAGPAKPLPESQAPLPALTGQLSPGSEDSCLSSGPSESLPWGELRLAQSACSGGVG